MFLEVPEASRANTVCLVQVVKEEEVVLDSRGEYFSIRS
jgi:hypothetical protein